MQVKILSMVNWEILEREINNFIKLLDNVVDIKFSTSQTNHSTIYSAIILYTK